MAMARKRRFLAVVMRGCCAASRKAFFFEKKKQKTFVNLHCAYGDMRFNTSPINKSFLVLFFKKEHPCLAFSSVIRPRRPG
jgi:hypothetical protein